MNPIDSKKRALLTIISRASDVSNEKKLKIAGANNVVMPEKVGGSHMATLVTRPDVIEFLEHLSIHGDEPTNLEEIKCNFDQGCNLGKMIKGLGVRELTGVNIIGFKSPEGEFILNPDADTHVKPGSKLFVLATSDQMQKIKEFLQSNNPL